MARFTALASTAALVAAGTSWELPVWARGGRMWKELSAAQQVGNSTVNIFQQAVDHADPSKTFSQRYYIDNTCDGLGGGRDGEDAAVEGCQGEGCDASGAMEG